MTLSPHAKKLSSEERREKANAIAERLEREERDNLTSFQTLTDEEAREVRERLVP